MNKLAIHVAVTEASLRESEQDVAEGVGYELLAIEIRPVLDAGPDSTAIGKAFILRQRGQFDAAVQVITAGLRFAPTDFRLLFNRGYLLYKLARYEKAIGDYTAAWALCADAAAKAQPSPARLEGTPHPVTMSRTAPTTVSKSRRHSHATACVDGDAAASGSSGWRRMGCVAVRWNMALW